MPNWCFTEIKIYHNNKNELKTFYELIQKWTSTNYMKNGFGLQWLGNIVGNSGIGTINKGQNTDLSCRGTLNDIELNEDYIYLSTDTAWEPMLQMWLKLIKKYLPNSESMLYYSAEEPGCELYITNDPDLVNKYNVIVWDIEDFDSEYTITENSLKEKLQKLLNTKETNINTLIQILQESEFSQDVYIHQWEYVNEYECD